MGTVSKRIKCYVVNRSENSWLFPHDVLKSYTWLFVIHVLFTVSREGMKNNEKNMFCLLLHQWVFDLHCMYVQSFHIHHCLRSFFWGGFSSLFLNLNFTCVHTTTFLTTQFCGGKLLQHAFCTSVVLKASETSKIQSKALTQQEFHFWLCISANMTLSYNFAHLFMRFAFGLMYLSTTASPSLTASNEKEMCPWARHKSTSCFMKVGSNCSCIFKAC